MRLGKFELAILQCIEEEGGRVDRKEFRLATLGHNASNSSTSLFSQALKRLEKKELISVNKSVEVDGAFEYYDLDDILWTGIKRPVLKAHILLTLTDLGYEELHKRVS